LVLVALAFAGGAPAAEDHFGIKIELPARSFIRGGLDPVLGLVATVTISNNSITSLTLPSPTLDPVGGTEFEVHLIGAPYGVKETPETPARTVIKRHVRLQPVGKDVPEIPGYTIAPGSSKEFRLDVGRNYRFKAAGRYEMACLYQGLRSNSVEFEVLPLKRVDLIPPVFVPQIGDYESGEPDFPFMFYIAPGQDRFDQIVYLMRSDSGPYEHYEYHRLGQVAPGVTPEMVVSGSMVGLLVPDKTNDNLTRFYVVDFGAMPMKATGEEFLHEPGSGPSMSVDESGEITAR
jgi:hypothetical protein